MKSIPFNKFNLRIIFTALLPLLLVSCAGTPITYPEPVENPVYLTAEAQTQDTRVKNVYGNEIDAENPETDEVYKDNHQTETSGPSTEIKNDWITLNIGGTLPKEILRITVKENTLNTPRSYEVKLSSQGNEGTLLIIQKGRDDD